MDYILDVEYFFIVHIKEIFFFNITESLYAQTQYNRSVIQPYSLKRDACQLIGQKNCMCKFVHTQQRYNAFHFSPSVV
jgi:hypothetical protein